MSKAVPSHTPHWSSFFAETSSHQLWHLQTRCSCTAPTWFTEHTQNLTFSLTQKHPVRRVICDVYHTLVVKRSCWKQIKLLQPPRRGAAGWAGALSPQTWGTTGVCTDPGVQIWGIELYLMQGFGLTWEHIQAEVSSLLFQTVHKKNIWILEFALQISAGSYHHLDILKEKYKNVKKKKNKPHSAKT